jgi:hypothetical protein
VRARTDVRVWVQYATRLLQTTVSTYSICVRGRGRRRRAAVWDEGREAQRARCSRDDREGNRRFVDKTGL